jgi:hypothetical protein
MIEVALPGAGTDKGAIEQSVGIFVDVEDGDPAGPGEEGPLDTAIL